MRRLLLVAVLLAPAPASADTSVPHPPESSDWKQRCADRVARAHDEAGREDGAFQAISKQTWTGKRDIEYSVESLDSGTFRWQAVVVDEHTVPEPKPAISAQGWTGNYHRFGKHDALPPWQYLDAKNGAVALGSDGPRVRFFRYEKRINGWVAVLQASGMKASTLRVYVDHFRAALDDCLRMAPAPPRQ